MKRLKIVLQSNYIYIILSFFTLIYSIYYINYKKHNSIYNINDTKFNFKVEKYKLEEDKLSLTLKGKEDIVATYYIKDNDEYNYIKDNLQYGDNIDIIGSLEEPTNNTIPSTFNYKKYLYYKDIHYILKIEQFKINKNNNIIYKIKNKINKRINKIDKKGYINAFILGNKDNINKNIYTNYQTCGITHLFALSGMHIGLISAIILKLLKTPKKALKYTITDIILILYGYIVGFPPSIKRCIIFFILNSINKIFNLKLSTIKIFILTILLIIIYNPHIIFDTGFQYSISTVFGIIYSSNYIKPNNKILNILTISIITFLFSLPITLISFYKINILSIIYNIFYIEYVTLIVYPLSLITFIFNFINPLFNLSINILELTSTYLSKIDILIFNLDFNIYEIIIYYILLIIIIKYKPKLLFINFLIVILDILYSYIDNNSYLYIFDVKQGDSSLLITPYKKEVILIDTGGIRSYNDKEYYISDNYITFLNSKNITKINTLIITHGDYDHMGDAINIINKIKVEKVIFNIDNYNNLENNLITLLEEKKIPYYKNINELELNKNSIYFLNTELFDNENDNSNVLYFNIYNNKILLMGDAGIKKEKLILNKYNLNNIDFIKIGHHGSDTSSNEEFINKINPSNCLISVGQNNKYGHPKQSVLNTLNNCNIYRTDEQGTIEIILNKKKYQIKTYNP